MRNNKLLDRLIFLIGWVLSPLTFWNDAFVNIPLSYICANIFIKIVRADFLFTVLAFYWITNGLGLAMMYFSGKSIFRDRSDPLREIAKIALTVIIYSILVVLLGRIGILRPII